MKNLAFWLTDRERDALFTLDLCPAAWLNFSRRTWESLAAKGLVNVAQGDAKKRVPVLRGDPAKSLTRGLRTLTRHVCEKVEKNIAPPAEPRALLAGARQEPLVLSEKVRPGLKS